MIDELLKKIFKKKEAGSKKKSEDFLKKFNEKEVEKCYSVISDLGYDDQIPYQLYKYHVMKFERYDLLRYALEGCNEQGDTPLGFRGILDSHLDPEDILTAIAEIVPGFSFTIDNKKDDGSLPTVVEDALLWYMVEGTVCGHPFDVKILAGDLDKARRVPQVRKRDTFYENIEFIYDCINPILLSVVNIRLYVLKSTGDEAHYIVVHEDDLKKVAWHPDFADEEQNKRENGYMPVLQ